MKNITVSVDDEVYRQARVVAAQRATSVSRLVGDFLAQLGPSDERFQRLLEQERRLRKSLPPFCAGDRLSRDELHRRGR